MRHFGEVNKNKGVTKDGDPFDVLFTGMALIVKTRKIPSLRSSVLAVERVLCKAKAVKQAVAIAARTKAVRNTL